MGVNILYNKNIPNLQKMQPKHHLGLNAINTELTIFIFLKVFIKI